ncbi:MAG: GTP-binding protein [Oscillospiraceae bacterium]|jgi:small GTP-binding protein|nr:GTP-binding protein [Oscillospiraceae bacterium]
MKFKNMIFGALASIFVMSIPVAKSVKGGVDVKVVLLGNTAVGKTSLVSRMVYGNFNPGVLPTLGASHVSLPREDGGRCFNLAIWDTAGQEVYKSLMPMYLRNAEIAVIVFSVDSSDSFKAIDFWLSTLCDSAPVSIKVILVASKMDLAFGSDITKEGIEQKARELGLPVYFCSALAGDGVAVLDDSIVKIAGCILDLREEAERSLQIRTQREREKCC